MDREDEAKRNDERDPQPSVGGDPVQEPQEEPKRGASVTPDPEKVERHEKEDRSETEEEEAEEIKNA